MYCSNCGNKVLEEWKYCPNCQKELQKGEDKKVEIKKVNQNKIGIIVCLILFFVGFLAKFLANTKLDDLSNLGPLISLVAIVTGFIKYPQSRTIKVLFWLYLSYIVLIIICSVLIIVSCGNAMNGLH